MQKRIIRVASGVAVGLATIMLASTASARSTAEARRCNPPASGIGHVSCVTGSNGATTCCFWYTNDRFWGCCTTEPY